MIEIPISLIKKLWRKIFHHRDDFCYHCQTWPDCCMHDHPDVPTYKIWICCECGRKRPDIF